MFNLGIGELTVIAIVLIIAVGPDRLPTLMKGIGKALRTVRQASRDIRSSVGIDELMRDDPPRPQPRYQPPPRTVSRPSALGAEGGAGQGGAGAGDADATSGSANAQAEEVSDNAKTLIHPASANAAPAKPTGSAAPAPPAPAGLVPRPAPGGAPSPFEALGDAADTAAGKGDPAAEADAARAVEDGTRDG